MNTHFCWSIETPEGHCPYCGGVTLLMTPVEWRDHEPEDSGETWEQVCRSFADDEITAHYCDECCRVTALSLNTAHPPKAATCEST